MMDFLFADMVWRGSAYGGGNKVILKLALIFFLPWDGLRHNQVFMTILWLGVYDKSHVRLHTQRMLTWLYYFLMLL
jgi:hypothetical protein